MWKINTERISYFSKLSSKQWNTS